MSAETLRTAANVMRVRARRALGELADYRWKALPTIDPDNKGWVVAMDADLDGYDTTVAHLQYDYEGQVAFHVASWHPAVALAVADWLDSEADTADYTAKADGMRTYQYVGPAMAVARAYLGESS